MDPETRRIRQRQVLLFSGIAAAVMVVFAVWISAGGGGESPQPSGIEAELVGSETAEASWVRRSEGRIGELETRLREMETRRRRSEQENAELRERLARNAEDGRVVIDRQAAAIEEMRRRLEARAATAVPAGADDVGRGAGRPASGEKVSAPPNGPAAPMIQEFESNTGSGGGRWRH